MQTCPSYKFNLHILFCPLESIKIQIFSYKMQIFFWNADGLFSLWKGEKKVTALFRQIIQIFVDDGSSTGSFQINEFL